MMTRHKQNTAIGCLIMFLFFSALLGLAGAQTFHPLSLEAGRIPWTDLTFHAKNFWVEVSTTVQLTSLPFSEVENELLAAPRGLPIKPTSPQISQMTINTIIDPKFRLPVNIYNRIWFNPMDAFALGRISLRRGEDDYKKIYRFTDRGVFRHQLEPKDKNEAALDPEKWTNIKDSFYPYDLTRLECGGVSERSLLIYILSAAAISKMNNPLSLCVFGKRQLHRVRLLQEGTYPLNVSFIEKAHQNEIHKEGRINALKIAISAEPLKSDLNEVENFSFLGLHKDIAIYIDPATHFPLQVSGVIPTIGTVHLNLNEVQTKYHPN
jgi:hypothetical protein